MKEIVAGLIDGRTLTTDARVLSEAYRVGRSVRWHSRAEMQLVAACDLDSKWNRLANAPTLFCLNDDGLPMPPNTVLAAAALHPLDIQGGDQ